MKNKINLLSIFNQDNVLINVLYRRDFSFWFKLNDLYEMN